MRPPDFVVGSKGSPYLRRWWLIPRNRWLNVYLHEIVRDDDDRALHDHPWWNLSLILRGSYIEVVPDLSAAGTPYTRLADLPQRRRHRRRFSLILRRPTDAHRLELIPGRDGSRQPVWSLFLTGPYCRPWGFHCPHGWRHSKDFVAADDDGAVGRGCD